MLKKLWNDEAGVVSIEYLFLATVVGLGVIIGFANLEYAINVEYTELANAILALNQGYTLVAQSGCKASRAGSAATDVANTVGFTVGTAPAGSPVGTTTGALCGF